MSDPSLMDNIVHIEDRGHLQQTSTASEQGGKDWNWQGRMVIRGVSQMDGNTL